MRQAEQEEETKADKTLTYAVRTDSNRASVDPAKTKTGHTADQHAGGENKD